MLAPPLNVFVLTVGSTVQEEQVRRELGHGQHQLPFGNSPAFFFSSAGSPLSVWGKACGK